MTEQQRVLRSPFDVTTHKATFVNYLEVVITPNGTIDYANQSHQGVMTRLANAKGIYSDDCPRDRWLDYDGWLREVKARNSCCSHIRLAVVTSFATKGRKLRSGSTSTRPYTRGTGGCNDPRATSAWNSAMRELGIEVD